MSNKYLTIGLLVAIVIAIGGYLFPQVQEAFGSQGTRLQHGLSVNTNTSPTANGFKVGDNGTEMVELKAATCNLTDMDVAHTATTTQPYDCAVTGVASGDVVMAQLSTTTQGVATSTGWMVTRAVASTTAGHVTVMVANLSGGTDIPSRTGVGSSTNIWYMDI